MEVGWRWSLLCGLIFVLSVVFMLFLRNCSFFDALCLVFGLCCFLLGTAIYLPSILGLLGVGFVFWWLLPVAIIGFVIVFPNFWLYIEQFFNGTAPLVSEEMVASGVPWIAFLIPFVFDIPKRFKLPALVLLAMGFFKAKVMLFAVPWLALGIVEADEKFKTKRWWPNLIAVGLVFCCAFSFMAYFTAPTTQDFDSIKEAIQLSKDTNLPLYNDWDYGWWFWYNGYETKYKISFPNPDWNKLPKPYIAYTDLNLPCEQLKEKVFICK